MRKRSDRRLIRKDVLGEVQFEWNPATRRQFGFSDLEVKSLDAGELVHSPLRGGTDFHLIKIAEPSAEVQVVCPMCAGTGHVDRHRIYGRSEEVRERGKIA